MVGYGFLQGGGGVVTVSQRMTSYVLFSCFDFDLLDECQCVIPRLGYDWPSAAPNVVGLEGGKLSLHMVQLQLLLSPQGPQSGGLYLVLSNCCKTTTPSMSRPGTDDGSGAAVGGGGTWHPSGSGSDSRHIRHEA